MSYSKKRLVQIEFLSGAVATIFNTAGVSLAWLDARYVSSLHLPSNAGSVSIPIIGGIISGLIGIGINALICWWIWVALRRKTKIKTIDLWEFMPTTELRRANVIKVIALIILLVGFGSIAYNYQYVNPLVAACDLLSNFAAIASDLILISLLSALFIKR